MRRRHVHHGGDARHLPGKGAGAEGVDREAHLLAGADLGRGALRDGARVLQRVGGDHREERGVVLDELAHGDVALGHDPRERGRDDRVGEALPPELDGRLPLADQRLGGLDGAEIRLELGLGGPHLIPVLAERGLGHLDDGLGGLGLRARLVDVARRDQLLGQQLLVPLELAALPLGVGAGPLDVGRERPAAVPHPLEVGAARVRRRPRPREVLAGRAEIRLELVDREVRLAAVQIRERLAFPDGVPEVHVEPDDRARELRAGDGFLPREEAPDRVDAPLDRAALDEGGRDAEGRGLGRGGAALRRPGRARLRPRAARKQEPPESDEQDGGDGRAGGGAARGPGCGRHGRDSLYQGGSTMAARAAPAGAADAPRAREPMLPRTPMTREGHARLQQELDQLKRVERHSIIKAIAEARAHGDLSENAEYHAAKERQGFIEGRIRELEAKLSGAEVIEPPKDGTRITFGSTVRLRAPDGKEMRYQIVGSDEADPALGRISILSPIARTLIGKEVGDEVKVQAPGGARELEIVAANFPWPAAGAGS